MDASASSSSAAAPPAHPSVLDTIQTKLSPGVLLVVAILAMVFFIFGLLNLLVQNILRLRRARRRRLRVGDADGSPTALQGQLQQLFHLHDAGVDQAFIDALPVFLYRDIVKGAGIGKEEEDGPFDCAVCLCEFAMDDGLRLLPTCGHAFHVPCIDAWLLSHSTCPLCRGSVLADLDLAPELSSPTLLVLEPDSAMEAPGVDNEGEPKEGEEEVVEVKLGKLRCVDGIGNGGVTGDLAVETTSRSSDDNGRRSLGQRRCLSMGSYEYVMADRAALRVAIKTPKKLQSASRSRRRRHALSDFDFGFGNAKKLGAPAWEAAMRDHQAADAVAAGSGSMRCGGDGAAASRLKKDSFSVSKIWMVPAGRKEDGRALMGGGSRRSVSFRWPAIAAEASRNNEGGGNEERRDVEAQTAQPGTGSPFARTAPLWAAGGWQPSSSAGSHP